MTENGILSSLCCAAIAASCYSQESTLIVDTSNLRLTASMDRTTYLPGEVAQVTLTVSNPGSAPVTSLKPFLTETSCLYFTGKNDPPAWQASALGASCVSVNVGASNTTTFGPGESKQVVLNSYDPLFDIGRAIFIEHSAPTGPGAYTLHFRFGSSSVQTDFTVADAKLEADTLARLQDVMFSAYPRRVPPSPLPMYVHVLAMRSEGESYICVQQATVSNTHLVAHAKFIDGTLDVTDPRVQMISAVKRVATSSAPVVGLSATADRDENLTIEWTDSGGGKGQVFYPASYPARSKAYARNQ